MKKFGFLKKQCPRVPKVYRSTQTSARAKREERREKTIGRRRKRDERIEKREERKTKRRLGVHSPSCPRVRTGGFSVLRGKETGRGQIVTRLLTTLPNGQGVGGLDKIPSSKVFGASCITCIRSRTKSRPNDEQRTLLVLLIADPFPVSKRFLMPLGATRCSWLPLARGADVLPAASHALRAQGTFGGWYPSCLFYVLLRTRFLLLPP